MPKQVADPAAQSQSIVCATDLTARSEPAEIVARLLAERLGDRRVHLVHVAREKVVSDAAVRLQEHADRLRRATDVEVTSELESQATGSTIADCLDRVASRIPGAIIVLASQGHAEERFPRQHGTTESVAATSSAPVLVVRDARPWQAWAGRERPLNVLLAVDPSPSSEAAIAWVKTLRDAGGCDVVVTQVYYAREAAEQYGVNGRISHVTPDPTVEHLIERDLRRRVESSLGVEGVEYRATLGVGRIGDHVLETAERVEADLVVVGTHNKQGVRRLSSVAAVAVHYGQVSIACVPRSAASKTIGASLIERVLVATDFSDLANLAIPYAYALLGRHGGHVHLLHVADPAGRENNGVQLAERLRHLVPPDPLGSDISTYPEVVRSANPSEAIVTTAARIGADIICLASHGRTGLRRVLLGSVAESVLRSSPCPVFVVRPPHD